jgi:hypothetical protein
MKKRAGLTVLCLLFGASSASAMNLGLSLGVGISFPSKQIVRDIYGAGFPFGGRIWAGKGNYWISAGVDYLSSRGQALSLDGGQEEYPVELTVISIPIAIYFMSNREKFFYSLGGGAYYSRYEEKWEDLDITTTGTKWGWLAEFMGGYDLSPNFALFGSLSYAPIPTGRSSPIAYNIQLGGLRLTAGVLVLLN